MRELLKIFNTHNEFDGVNRQVEEESGEQNEQPEANFDGAAAANQLNSEEENGEESEVSEAKRNAAYLRFGKRNPPYLRFGRNNSYLRFGKRQPASYLRYGKRNPAYLRFGRSVEANLE